MKLDGTARRPVPWSKSYIGQGFGCAEQPYRWQAYQNHLLWQEHLQRFFPRHMKLCVFATNAITQVASILIIFFLGRPLTILMTGFLRGAICVS